MSIVQPAADDGLLDGDVQDPKQRHAGARGGQHAVDAEHPLVGDHEPIAVFLQDSPQRLQGQPTADDDEHPEDRRLVGKGTDKDHEFRWRARTPGQALAAQCFLTSTTFSSPAVVKMYLSTCGSSQLTTPMAKPASDWKNVMIDRNTLARAWNMARTAFAAASGLRNQIKQRKAHDQEDDYPLDPLHVGLFILPVFPADYSNTPPHVQARRLHILLSTRRIDRLGAGTPPAVRGAVATAFRSCG